MSEPTHRPTRAERAESVVLVAILLVVGLAAGAASFTHVHDWTMTNSPAGTPDWFGWANACISELVPVAALLDIRRRRRASKAAGYPLALLVAAAGLSLSAQLAVAKPGLSGGILSAVPALAFMALVKLVFSSAPATATPATATATPTTATTPATAASPAPVVALAPAPAPAKATAARTTSARPRRSATTATTATADDVTARVVALLAEQSTATAEDVAEAIGRRPRTARRYLSAARARMAATAPAMAAA